MTLSLDFDLTDKKIFVCGHEGMVGSALLRRLKSENYTALTVNRHELNLCNDDDVKKWFLAHKPDAVIMAAAKVGGIMANDTMPVPFLLDNLRIQNAVIQAAYESNVKKLLFLGSSCIYPVHAHQPMSEESLLTGPLEPTNQWYAIAKIAGIKLCQAYRKQHGVNFISAMPTNLYGPNDNFRANESHVVAALIARLFLAKQQRCDEIEIWGSGTPLREFLHVDDLADGLVFLLQHYNQDSPINIGSGEEVCISDLAKMLREISGWKGVIKFDATKPDGAPRKAVQNDRIHDLGWHHKIHLKAGLATAYEWFANNQDTARL